MKAGLLQSVEHVVAGFLRAELRGENPGIEERGETHDDGALALGILSPAHLRIRSRKSADLSNSAGSLT